MASDTPQHTKAAPLGLHATIISRNTRIMKRQWLPGIREGRFYFDELSHMLYVVVDQGKWQLCCVKPAFFVSPQNQPVQTWELSESCLIPFVNENQQYFLHMEFASEEGSTFTNYEMRDNASIKIGRAEICDVIVNSTQVSREHATIMRTSGDFFITDHSSNGTYVNGRLVEQSLPLNVGDTIFIMGAIIVVGKGFLSINDSRTDITVSTYTMFPLKLADASPYAKDPQPKAEKGLFNREPRHRLALKPEDIEIEAPPMSLDSSETPFLLRSGSSILSAGTSIAMGSFMPLLSSLVLPAVTQKYTDAQKKEYEAKRIELYTAYLEQKKKAIEAEIAEEGRILNANYPEIGKVLGYPRDLKKLWERRNVDDDFLSLRIGYGNIPLKAKITGPKRHFGLEEDELETKMFSLLETEYKVPNAPLMASLIDDFVWGIKGDKGMRQLFVAELIAQMAILHSPEELRLVFLGSERDLEQMSFVKTLPHFWNEQQSMRFVATDGADAYAIGDYLRTLLEEEESNSGNKNVKSIIKERPYFCVIALDKQVLDGIEVLKEVMQSEENRGISVIAAYPELPKECMVIATISESGRGSMSYLNDIEREDDPFSLDATSLRGISDSLKLVSNVNISLAAEEQALPKSVTFLEMFKVGRIEQLAPLRRWRENNPVKTLATPIGIAPDGGVAVLDLHEKKQGPHGLVAGMTGSGKSEVLLTYILSMAINYSPDEVAFVLIDYKGGGLAGAFVDPKKGLHLPHVVGTITNLDGSAIQRSLISLDSEVKRRQRQLNDAKSIVNEGTMNIYDYQKYYRKGMLPEPMPHLFIISDEFAELKQQQPEFMDHLVSVARIGRSLGVHLILATQKPSGVVNDQIRSNAKFKLCMKVQTREDSMDMLRRPEAAELTQIGRYYLQVGYNESFSMGQSGWSGAPYEPCDAALENVDDSVVFVDLAGQSIHEAKPIPQRESTGKTQLVAIVDALTKISTDAGYKPRMLWEDELPKVLDLDGLLEKYKPSRRESLSVPVGLVDDPANLRQFPLEIDLLNIRNMLVLGDPGAGNTTFVQSLIYSIMKNYTPNEVVFYALDYSSQMLDVFASLPHCGAVLGERDTGSVPLLFDTIQEIAAERKRLFKQWGVGSYELAREYAQKEGIPLPLVCVFIDNISGLSGNKTTDSLLQHLNDFMKNNYPYGIRFIATASRTNEVPSRARQEFADRIALAQKDKHAYTDALGVRCTYSPQAIPGRGLAVVDEAPLEFQAAAFRMTEDGVTRSMMLKEEVARLCAQLDGCAPAKKIPVIIEGESYEEFASRFASKRLPLGYALKTAREVALPLRQLKTLSLFFGEDNVKVPVWHNILHAAKREGMEVYVAKRFEKSIFDNADDFADVIGADAKMIKGAPADVVAFTQTLMSIVQERNAAFSKYCLENGISFEKELVERSAFPFVSETMRPILIAVERMSDFFSVFAENPSESEESNREAVTAGIIFDSLLKCMFCLNMYVVAGFDESDPSNASRIDSYRAASAKDAGYDCSTSIAKWLISGGDSLIFGSQFDKQKAHKIPRELQAVNPNKKPGIGIMRYRDEYHPIMMPCAVKEETVPEDEASIF